jgi:hypothetical protein
LPSALEKIKPDSVAGNVFDMVPDTSKSSKDDSDGKKLYQNPFMKQPGTSTELNGVGLPEGMTWVSPKGQPLHPPRPLPTCKEFSKRGMLLLTKDKVSEADGLRVSYCKPCAL